MSGMTTVLQEFSELGNSVTYIIPASHTAVKPRVVVQRRKVATGASEVAEDMLTVSYATDDADGNILPTKVAFGATVKRPINGDSADTSAALATFRDIVASDEFTALVNMQSKLGS